jgi:hypothetical protein
VRFSAQCSVAAQHSVLLLPSTTEPSHSLEILIFALLVKEIRTFYETRNITLFTISCIEMLAPSRLNPIYMLMLRFIVLTHTAIIYVTVTDIVNAISSFRGD